MKPISEFVQPRGMGHFFAAVDIGLFLPVEEYQTIGCGN